MSNKYTREKIKIPTSIKPRDRVRIAEVIVNLIINRTAAGLDKNNKEFPNDGSFKSNQRLRAYNFAKQWLVMAAENIKTTTHDQP